MMTRIKPKILAREGDHGRLVIEGHLRRVEIFPKIDPGGGCGREGISGGSGSWSSF